MLNSQETNVFQALASDRQETVYISERVPPPQEEFQINCGKEFWVGLFVFIIRQSPPGIVISDCAKKKYSLKTTREQTTCISQNLQETAVLLWSKNSAPFWHLSERWVASQSNWTLIINQWRTHSKNNSYLCSINCQTSTSAQFYTKQWKMTQILSLLTSRIVWCSAK